MAPLTWFRNGGIKDSFLAPYSSQKVPQNQNFGPKRINYDKSTKLKYTFHSSSDDFKWPQIILNGKKSTAVPVNTLSTVFTIQCV